MSVNDGKDAKTVFAYIMCDWNKSWRWMWETEKNWRWI